MTLWLNVFTNTDTIGFWGHNRQIGFIGLEMKNFFKTHLQKYSRQGIGGVWREWNMYQSSLHTMHCQSFLLCCRCNTFECQNHYQWRIAHLWSQLDFLCTLHRHQPERWSLYQKRGIQMGSVGCAQGCSRLHLDMLLYCWVYVNFSCDSNSSNTQHNDTKAV